jgi:hypothetical protein
MEERLLCEPDALCHLGRAGPIAMDDIEGFRRIGLETLDDILWDIGHALEKSQGWGG